MHIQTLAAAECHVPRRRKDTQKHSPPNLEALADTNFRFFGTNSCREAGERQIC